MPAWGRRYTLPAPKGKKGKELTDELAALINADPDAPFTASSGAGSGDNGAGLKGSLGITARFTGECSVHDVRLNYHDGEATPEGIQVAIAYPKQKRLTRISPEAWRVWAIASTTMSSCPIRMMQT